MEINAIETAKNTYNNSLEGKKVNLKKKREMTKKLREEIKNIQKEINPKMVKNFIEVLNKKAPEKLVSLA